MSYVDQIVSRFSSVGSLSRASGEPYSAGRSWKGRGSIADEHKPDVLAAARQHEIALTPSDFFPNTDGVLPTAAR